MRIRQVLTALGLIGLAVIIIIHAGEFKSFIGYLGELRWYGLVAMIAVQLSSYYANARYYQSFLGIFDRELSRRHLYEASLAINFVNNLVPAAGLAGATFLTAAVKEEVPTGEAMLAQIVRQAFSFLSVVVIAPIGLLLLFFTGHSNSGTAKLIAIILGVVVVGALAILYLVDHEEQARRFGFWLLKTFNSSGRFVLRGKFKPVPKPRLEKLFDEFYNAYHLLAADKKRLVEPFAWSLAYILIEVFTVWLAFAAFSHLINFGVVIVGYTLANAASALGGVISSIGVFEAGMIGTFVALGTPLALALPVTVVYRMTNMAFFLPPGFYYYRKHLK